MNPYLRLVLHLSLGALLLTGGAFAWMKYGMATDDPFAAANHPLQPWMLRAHVVVAPVAVFALGWAFAEHITPKLRNGRMRRGTGIAGIALAALMIASGYLIQVVVADAWLFAARCAHWISSGLFSLSYVMHLLGPRPPREKITP